ncbi:MAG: alpha-isopropylmalate synthase regulatory domain-containing protein [bacterium]|nr:alpha-isopropylmalate synthase regulatory domain-containing protein [bacterium]
MSGDSEGLMVAASRQFSLDGFMYYTVGNGPNEPTHVGQLRLSFAGEAPTMQQAHGVGPIDVMFSCVKQHALARNLLPDGLQLTDYVLHANMGENGSKSPAMIRVRLQYNGHQADGEATGRDILVASINALVVATNNLLNPSKAPAVSNI